MPDDNFRPTHGVPPDSRPTNVPPEWWSLLDRDDLPRGMGDLGPSGGARWMRTPRLHLPRWQRLHGGGLRLWRPLVVGVLLLAMAAMLLAIGIAYQSPEGIPAIVLGCGVVALTALLGIRLVRSLGRRW